MDVVAAPDTPPAPHRDLVDASSGAADHLGAAGAAAVDAVGSTLQKGFLSDLPPPVSATPTGRSPPPCVTCLNASVTTLKASSAASHLALSG